MVPFLSVVVVVRNQQSRLEELLANAVAQAALKSVMCEVIVVDNASTDGSAEKLRQLSSVLPDLQVYVLSRKVGRRVAERLGMESALGDIIQGSRTLTRDELNMELQMPLHRGIRIGSLFIGIFPRVPHVSQEFGSTKKTRRQRLNVEHAA